jgi:hypothetical protein
MGDFYAAVWAKATGVERCALRLAAVLPDVCPAIVHVPATRMAGVQCCPMVVNLIPLLTACYFF